MAYISCDKLWECKFDDIVSRNNKVQDLNINQSKHAKYMILRKRMKN